MERVEEHQSTSTDSVTYNGPIIESYEYTCGRTKVFNAEGTLTPDHISLTPILFTERRPDQETELYYFRARMYGAKLGRFVSRDPIGYRDGYNLYTGGGVGWLDPFGKECNVSSNVTLPDVQVEVPEVENWDHPFYYPEDEPIEVPDATTKEELMEGLAQIICRVEASRKEEELNNLCRQINGCEDTDCEGFNVFCTFHPQSSAKVKNSNFDAQSHSVTCTISQIMQCGCDCICVTTGFENLV